MSVSLPVAIGDIVMASDHNNLRIDLLNLSTGHVHDGVEARTHVYLPVTPAGLQANGAIYLDNTLNTSYGLRVYSNIGNTATQPLVSVTTANATFSQYGVGITYAGTSHALVINNSSGTGMGLYVYSSQGVSQSFPLVSFRVVGGGTFDQTLLELQNTSVGIGIELVHASTNYGLKITSNIGASATQALVEFNASNAIFGKNVLNILSSGNKAALAINASACSPLNIPTKATAPTNVTTNDIYLDSGANTYLGKPAWKRYMGSVFEEISPHSPYNRLFIEMDLDTMVTGFTGGSSVRTTGGAYTQITSGNALNDWFELYAGRSGTRSIFNHAATLMLEGSFEYLNSSASQLGWWGLMNSESDWDPPSSMAVTSAHASFIQNGNDTYCSSANGTTQETTLITITEERYNKYRIEHIPGVSNKFYVNDVLVATHTTYVGNTSGGYFVCGIKSLVAGVFDLYLANDHVIYNKTDLPLS